MKNADLKIVNKKKMRLSLSELYAKISIHGVEKNNSKITATHSCNYTFFHFKKINNVHETIEVFKSSFCLHFSHSIRYTQMCVEPHFNST